MREVFRLGAFSTNGFGSMIASNKPRVLALDFLRVLAISLILFSHVLITLGQPWNQLNLKFSIINGLFYYTSWGEIGVTIFLVVSGFSLAYRYGDKKFGFGTFYLRRIARIYPIYFMSLLLGVAVPTLFTILGCLRYGEPASILPNLGIEDIFLALTGFYAFAGKWGGPFVWSSWFIGLIMALYLLYPALSHLIRRKPWAAIVLLFFVSLFSRVVVQHFDLFTGNPKEWFPFNRVFEFGFGIFLFKVLRNDIFMFPNNFLKFFPGLRFLSAISFPLFLMHDPLRKFIVIDSSDIGYLALGVGIFLSLSLIVSSIALSLDRKIQESLKFRFQLNLN